jgi:hypothetical protein
MLGTLAERKTDCCTPRRPQHSAHLALIVVLIAGIALSWTASAHAIAPTPETASGLPDDRAYELVSPPKEGELYLPAWPQNGFGDSKTGLSKIYSGSRLPFESAVGGNAVAWVGEPATTGGTGETGTGLGNQWLSIRTPSGWRSSDITPVGSEGAAFPSFSEDLGTAFGTSNEGPPLTVGVPTGCEALYSRDSASGTIAPLLVPEGECGHPLFAGSDAQRARSDRRTSEP